MVRYKAVSRACVLGGVLLGVCCGIVLHRSPRHASVSRNLRLDSGEEEQDAAFDSLLLHKHDDDDLKSIVSGSREPAFRGQKKRGTSTEEEEDRHELADILRDEDPEEEAPKKKKKPPAAPAKHPKTKRQSSDEPKHEDLQEVLRQEYYRSMARNFASMRRKRGLMEPGGGRPRRTPKRASPRFEEVTDNLRAIEDLLFLDALQTLRGGGDEEQRVSDDLSSAYDLETMRAALVHLRDTLGRTRDDDDAAPATLFKKDAGKRGEQCPPLDLLSSDCSALGDVVSDGPLKRLLLHACNWHEVCYTCGEVFGLASEDCDVGFVEQSQTLCRGDAPCESTASLLLLPLRQRRVFYKRSNPSVCLVDPCVERFLAAAPARRPADKDDAE